MTNTYKKLGAAAGIAYPIIQMTAQGLIQIGGMEPAFSAPANEILQFFQKRDLNLFNVGEILSVFSVVVFLWFVGALWDELKEIEGGNGWLSFVAVGSGIGAATAFTRNGWNLAMFRIDTLDPSTAQIYYDLGNATFANAWVLLGSMVLAAGLIYRDSDSASKWMSTGSIWLGAAMILARIIWTSQIAFVPFTLFWVWMIALGVRMRRSA